MGRISFFIFLHSKGNCEKWCLITKFEYHVCGMTTLRQAVGNDMKKYSSHLIFTFYLNRVTLVMVIFPFIVFHQKQLFNQSVLTQWLAKLLDRGRKIQNDIHITSTHNLIFCHVGTKNLPISTVGLNRRFMSARLDVLCPHSCLSLMVVHRKTYTLIFLW